ncbi:DNA-binding transcriptional regulator, HxlR family [Paractinoplanes atraurantiacus]|uniref:DNA-binding transcriptional regulator, HxlR family n=1 Tax=Paractinoplanes atraurantiacus TaxID=1036182 RepID=A0A285IG39_9ACTN|nr:DNA-binding transcriptional regulator, HxlR family [Actinoplanes atraurantiacus]
MHFVVADDDCRDFQSVLEFIGRRWVGAVLMAGAQGARRFTEYRALAPGISDRLLAQRLKELESYQLLRREVIPSTPVQILYTPSPTGAALIAALQPLIAWSRSVPPAGGDQRP